MPDISVLNNKFKFTTESKIVDGITVYRIQATRDLPLNGVKSGDLGGYLVNDSQLSYDGDCWVGGSSVVIGLSIISGNSIITDNAKVIACNISGNVRVCSNAVITNVTARGFAVISGIVKGLTAIFIQDNVVIGGTAVLEGNMRLTDNVNILGSVIGSFTAGGDLFLGSGVNAQLPLNFDMILTGNVSITTGDQFKIITNVE